MKKLARRTLYDQVKARDRYMCQMCETTLRLTVHHIIPQSEGGKDEIDNLIVLCEDCHTNTHHAYRFGIACPKSFLIYLEAMRITNDLGAVRRA